MNSAFHAGWLASSEVISQVLFTSEEKQNGFLFQIKLLFGPLVIQLDCVVYTKTIIHLSVGESGEYYILPPLRWIIVKLQSSWKIWK